MDELLLKISPFLRQELSENQVPGTGKKRSRILSMRTESNQINDCKNKKIMHRDIERQRRQEMKGLYASLGSLLPIEYIKEKRSISDHMEEAAVYIKNTETRIQKMRNKRDNMNKSSSIPNTESFCVSVDSCLEGVEILITYFPRNVEAEVVSLSRVLLELINTNLTVTSCIFTRAAENRFIYTIQSKVNDSGSGYVDPLLLKQKLMNLTTGF